MLTNPVKALYFLANAMFCRGLIAAWKFLLRVAFTVIFLASPFVAHAQTDDLNTAESVITNQSAQAKQQADFKHILFEYFQTQYDNTLMLIEVADASHQFALLSQDDQDRLRLMQGAARLNVGLYKDAQTLLLQLLSKTTSEYVQANTWFWVAKAGFANRQYDLSERAYEAMQEDDLVEFIDDAQWQELLYLTAFSRMQQEQDWQNIYTQLDESTIYKAYLQANLASSQFNAGEFALAQESFITAKQALLTYERIKQSWLRRAGKSAREALNFAWLNPFNWFLIDPNAQSQAKQEAEQENAQRQEIDALFDRINLGLAYALLQQQDDANALEVINTVSKQGGESEQALLTLGWTLAQQNRWQNALSVWQYLHEQSTGIYALQASYGMAYAYQQQGNFTQAFYALDDTTTQILGTIEALQRFSDQIKKEDFFDTLAPLEDSETQNANVDPQASSPSQTSPKEPKRVESISELAVALGLEPDPEEANSELGKVSSIENEENAWPVALLDLKRMFMSTQPNFDAAYLLGVRREAKQMLAQLEQKSQQLATLEQMLAIRKQRFAERQQALSLSQIKQALEQANTQIKGLNTQLSDREQQQNLQLAMASAEQMQHITRINNAQQRLTRLQNDNTRSRPLNPKLEERLARIQGILQWQLDNDFVAKRWQHTRMLQQAQQAVDEATISYQRLLLRQTDSQQFASQQLSIEALAVNIAQQEAQARAIYAKANAQLQDNLLMLVEQRVAQLNTQQVNTRLAKLRLQDLTPEAQ